ncbi:hypothetical protein PHSY_002480 [Pseudozyma hubeiensis SY62]|uniref:Uncharacterized protein n=1 Tax=Pseudozyma hubeiensis (strain SY62) TaxID=1305764 RepID=R9P1C8_PSEHS|nr:hypothetical protein PHSY_002480 [Pseudozyma hubeiensis SY62]GAC94907.1 hypothetical protein PHSY_002480 [Pseudozyma hubeiensis SY62]
MRNRGKAEKEPKESIAARASKNKKNKKKNKDAAIPVAAASASPAPETKKEEEVKQPVVQDEPVAVQTASQKKKAKKQKQQQQTPSQAEAASNNDTYAEVAETTPAINNETIRAKADAAQAAFTASLGDMRDADVDPLPAGYSSVARIPAPQAEAPRPKLSKKDLDDGWSSVGGSSSSATAAKLNGNSTASKPSSNGVKTSIASTNPFAALPDDATTSSVRRIPAKPTNTLNNINGGGWTVASHTAKPRNGSTTTNGVSSTVAETKKQRSNANKAQAKKQAKDEADRLQAERLANHRREQANAAAKEREAAKRPTPRSVPGSSGKVPNAKASVDLNGRLVWD